MFDGCFVVDISQINNKLYGMRQDFDFNISGKTLTLNISGDFISYDNEELKLRLYSAAEDDKVRQLIVNANQLGQWDSTLAIIIFELKKIALKNQKTFELRNFPQNFERLINLAFSVDRKPVQPDTSSGGFLENVGIWGTKLVAGVHKGFNFIKASGNSFFRSIVGRSFMRGIDLSFALEDCTYKALPIVSLISFMVGLILAFVGAVQLKTFGAQIYVASLVTIGMTRIMGAIMTGIIMAGRTGASYAATIGTMQVNEEVDALKTMGVDPMDFLVSPRMIALIITMPLLTMWSDFMGMLGGGFVGVTMLGIPFQKYWELSIDAISLDNFLVGIFHGLVFGVVIAICGCYYGIFCGRNADSVGSATTKAVVSAIVWMIVMTGIITVCCEVLDI